MLNKSGVCPPAPDIPIGRPIKLPKICETNTIAINILHSLIPCSHFGYCGKSGGCASRNFNIAWPRLRNTHIRILEGETPHISVSKANADPSHLFLSAMHEHPKTCKLDHIHSDSQNSTSMRTNARDSSYNPCEAYEDSSPESITQVLHKYMARKKLDRYVA